MLCTIRNKVIEKVVLFMSLLLSCCGAVGKWDFLSVFSVPLPWLFKWAGSHFYDMDPLNLHLNFALN